MLSFMFLFVVMVLEFREARDCGLDGSFFVMMCVSEVVPRRRRMHL
jgi:hypothetical protein